MKLKEIPTSIYHTLRLKSLRTKSLHESKDKSLPIIISLTTIPSRLKTLHITVRSILDQSKKPEKVVLWLNEDHFELLPDSLRKIEGDRFEIISSPYTFSHRKLIHSLKKYQDQIIVTCDDDMIYRKNWLALIYNEHLKKPKAVIGNQTRYIQYDSKGNVLPYKQWLYPYDNQVNQNAILPIGAEGVLYPPNCLDSRVVNVDLFMQLAPKADDLWFKAMSLLKGTRSIQAENRPKKAIPIFGTQAVSLKKHNIDHDKNRTQWEALIEYFGIEL
ncbi:glycosyltransferase family A protein [Spongiivirga sp. MCCC 1A20706]|uniref:glycosyltransferase family A protein n=1 Tax=Spongiivirga sp. MCCC 1A20706 TaxID=3160963 RepID=UPI003977BC0B